MNGRCRPVRHTRPALPMHLSEPWSAEESERDVREEEDEEGDLSESDDSEFSDEQHSDSD